MLVALRLSKAGYGTPQDILEAPTEVVLGALAYEKFLQDYEQAFIDLNKESR